MKRKDLLFYQLKEVHNFILKFHTVPTLCGNCFFNDYVGHALWFNLKSSILVPVGAVLLFIALKNRSSEIILL